MSKLDLSHLADPGREIRVKATPRAAFERIVDEGDQLRVYITVPAENGKANAAIQKVLAKALGLPKSRLTLKRGATSRDKVFVVT